MKSIGSPDRSPDDTNRAMTANVFGCSTYASTRADVSQITDVPASAATRSVGRRSRPAVIAAVRAFVHTIRSFDAPGDGSVAQLTKELPCWSGTARGRSVETDGAAVDNAPLEPEVSAPPVAPLPGSGSESESDGDPDARSRSANAVGAASTVRG